MDKFEFKVKIQAQSNARAKVLLAALFDIKRILSEEDLLLLADKIKQQPGLVKKAKRFL